MRKIGLALLIAVAVSVAIGSLVPNYLLVVQAGPKPIDDR